MSITRERLKGASSEGEALALYSEVKAKNEFFAFTQCFMHDEDYQVARNALWSMTKATDAELSQLQPMLHELINLALSAENSSVRRLTLNVIYRLHLSEEDLRTDFLDFCLEHMTDVSEYPGIQSLCMKLAYKMCLFYTELMGELIRTLKEMEIEHYKPAVKCVRNKILAGKTKGITNL